VIGFSPPRKPATIRSTASFVVVDSNATPSAVISVLTLTATSVDTTLSSTACGSESRPNRIQLA